MAFAKNSLTNILCTLSLATVTIAIPVDAGAFCEHLSEPCTGPEDPHSIVSDASNGGVAAWANPGNASDGGDGLDATASVSGSGRTEYLKATTFGAFDGFKPVPADATITGIEVNIYKELVSGSASDHEVMLVKNGVIGSANRARGPWPGGFGDFIHTYGGENDLWGLTWNVGDVMGPGFGVVLSAQASNALLRVDWFRLSIWFEPPPPICPDAPDPSCHVVEKGLLLMDERGFRTKLVAKFRQGPALSQTGFGNPLEFGGTAYRTCFYDDGGILLGSTGIDHAGAHYQDRRGGSVPKWRPLGRSPSDPKGPGVGYRYRGSSFRSPRIIRIKAGPNASSATVNRGWCDVDGGPQSAICGPSLMPALVTTTSVTMQLRGNDAPECLSVTLDEIIKQEPGWPGFFKAKHTGP